MNYIYTVASYDPVLAHHGIKGQKWGYRRWQNSDGSLTEEGRVHYGKGLPKVAKNIREKGLKKRYQKLADTADSLGKNEKDIRQKERELKKASDNYLVKNNKLSNAEYDYNKAVEKGENSLFGNRRNIKKANTQYKQAQLEENQTREAFEAADVALSKFKVDGAELKEAYLKDLTIANNKSDKYIKKYGSVSMRELISNDSTFRQNITKAESKKNYEYYNDMD